MLLGAVGEFLVQVDLSFLDEGRATHSWVSGGPLRQASSVGPEKGPRRAPQPEGTCGLASVIQGLLEEAFLKGWEGKEGKKLTACRLALTSGLQGKCDGSYLSDEDTDIWK